MKKIAFGLAALLLSASPALAQVSPKAAEGAMRSATFVPKAAAQTGRGFTIMADVGFGMQHDPFFGQTEFGVAGLNVAGGWFVTERLAILGRYTSTRVTFIDESEVKQSSGVAGGVIQYWMSDRAAIEVGGGSGWWTDKFEDGDTDSDRGFGLILAVRFVIFERGSHHMLVGAEYLPVFTDSKVHNFAITFAYQFFKKS